MMMGIPLLILYEISVVAVYFFGKKTFMGFQEEDGREGELELPETKE
jgi:sec-independent protein translocase protein TatC